MKQFLLLTLLILIGVRLGNAQIKRSEEFHQKYHLTGVAIFSRHNIRAPLAKPGSFITTITPYTWHDFGVNRSELTMKGGVLETINGQFFNQWVVNEGLFPENAEPTDEEMVVISNSKQRTISTARHFSSSFMPMKTVTVRHEGKLNDMDADFSMNLESDITETEWEQIRHETDSLYSPETLRQLSESLKPNFELLEDVLDIKNSPAYKDGSFTGFNDHNCQIVYALGKEPEMTASLNQACQAVDALILQYYEEPDLQKVAFGKELTREQWQMLYKIIHTKDHVRFCSPWVNRHVTQRLRHIFADALQSGNRKFTLLCGHDTNILNLLKSLRTSEYETTNAIEIGTPIGSKIVFERWEDDYGNTYVAVNHVYQTVDELRNNILLNEETTPNIIPLQFEEMTPNADGLFTIDQFMKRLTGQDDPTTIKEISAPTRRADINTYTISGVRVSQNYHGIVARDQKLQMSK